jgi:hypothetical protein
MYYRLVRPAQFVSDRFDARLSNGEMRYVSGIVGPMRHSREKDRKVKARKAQLGHGPSPDYSYRRVQCMLAKLSKMAIPYRLADKELGTPVSGQRWKAQNHPLELLEALERWTWLRAYRSSPSLRDLARLSRLMQWPEESRLISFAALRPE